MKRFKKKVSLLYLLSYDQIKKLESVVEDEIRARFRKRYCDLRVDIIELKLLSLNEIYIKAAYAVGSSYHFSKVEFIFEI